CYFVVSRDGEMDLYGEGDVGEWYLRRRKEDGEEYDYRLEEECERRRVGHGNEKRRRIGDASDIVPNMQEIPKSRKNEWCYFVVSRDGEMDLYGEGDVGEWYLRRRKEDGEEYDYRLEEECERRRVGHGNEKRRRIGHASDIVPNMQEIPKSRKNEWCYFVVSRDGEMDLYGEGDVGEWYLRRRKEDGEEYDYRLEEECERRRVGHGNEKRRRIGDASDIVPNMQEIPKSRKNEWCYFVVSRDGEMDLYGEGDVGEWYLRRRKEDGEEYDYRLEEECERRRVGHGNEKRRRIGHASDIVPNMQEIPKSRKNEWCYFVVSRDGEMDLYGEGDVGEWYLRRRKEDGEEYDYRLEEECERRRQQDILGPLASDIVPNMQEIPKSRKNKRVDDKGDQECAVCYFVVSRDGEMDLYGEGDVGEWYLRRRKEDGEEYDYRLEEE
ncbi:hypothetical protein PRIPAC_90195, partial [Pristionchus pacificus]|uniref:Uncharacterized protein n=1 Tax=Pristionchus pacificus TaxID=54126 RepID=A0A2A6B8Z6_PRIPA